MHFLKVFALFLCLALPNSAQAFFGFGVPPAPGPKGMQVNSDKPIFDASKGLRIRAGQDVLGVAEMFRDEVRVLGQRVAALRRPDSPPSVIAFGLSWQNGSYETVLMPGAGDVSGLSPFFSKKSQSMFWGNRFSIHRSDEDKLYIAQVERKQSDRVFYQYFYLRFVNGRLMYDGTAYDFKADAAQAASPRVEIRRNQAYVADRTALIALLDAQTKAEKHSNIKTARSTSRVYETFTLFEDLVDLRRQSFQVLCLHLAESPGDPNREHGAFDTSVPFQMINPDYAVPACEAAMQAGKATPSIRFATSRALGAKARKTNDAALAQRVTSILEGLASEGFSPALVNLALRKTGVPGVEPNRIAARDELIVLAKAGNADAALWLGRGFRQGYMRISEQDAVRYLQQAVNAGIVEAHGELAAVLLSNGGDAEKQRAAELLKIGVEKKDPESEFQRGLLLYKQQVFSSAYKQIDAAAKQGHLEALYYKGFMLMKGQGQSVSRGSAMVQFGHAARHGHTGSKMYLGHLLCTGKNAKAEALTRGKKLLEEAQKAGYQQAETYLKDCPA